MKNLQYRTIIVVLSFIITMSMLSTLIYFSEIGIKTVFYLLAFLTSTLPAIIIAMMMEDSHSWVSGDFWYEKRPFKNLLY